MLLNNEFMVGASPAETWRLLTDLERIAPCMPGASLVGREGEDYLGTVKIKVGPIGANFEGRARFLDQNEADGTATISMSGKDVKGAAAANAVLRARLEEIDSTTTRVYVDTELDISGRMAQFGRGAIADVSNRLLGQFTTNLSAMIDTSGGRPPSALVVEAPARPQGPAVASRSSAVAGAPPAGSDLNALSLVLPVVLKQLAVPLAAFVLGWLVSRAYPRRPR